jgi:methyl-accepting chemotaxis protein
MRISALRDVMLDSMVERVSISRVVSERQFDFVLAGFGVVVVAILESVASLSQSVVNPLAQLGLAITRIAAGDRSVPLAMRSGTREINEMVTAVETLRQAALIADAAALRQRMVARQRLELLRQALGIARSVQEPARALERGVASLSEGIDATIALIHAEAAVTPATLEVAADAVRIGLAEMRESAAGLDATFAAASEDQTEERPVAEFVAHILAVQAEVDRREQAVRRFVQSSLVALRDAESTAGERSMPVLHDLVSDQFLRIEATVATVASMRDAMTRATAIVRELPLDDTPMAA